MKPKVSKPKGNAEEGGHPEFWENDIDSPIDDLWAEKVRNLLSKSKKKSLPYPFKKSKNKKPTFGIFEE